jgi:hypothetical protein
MNEKEEEHELTKFFDFLDSKEGHIREHYLKAFILDKLDPKDKFVISAYADNNERIIKKNNLESNIFLGKYLKKIKLQIRLENTKDVLELINFLKDIASTLKYISDDEDINNKRLTVLNDIFEPKTNYKEWLKVFQNPSN